MPPAASPKAAAAPPDRQRPYTVDDQRAAREWREQWRRLKLRQSSPGQLTPNNWSPSHETKSAGSLGPRQRRRLKRRVLSLPIDSPILSKAHGKWRICPLKTVIDHDSSDDSDDPLSNEQRAAANKRRRRVDFGAEAATETSETMAAPGISTRSPLDLTTTDSESSPEAVAGLSAASESSSEQKPASSGGSMVVNTTIAAENAQSDERQLAMDSPRDESASRPPVWARALFSEMNQLRARVEAGIALQAQVLAQQPVRRLQLCTP